MGLLRKTEVFEKEGIGTVAIVDVRLPFRVFSRNPESFFFRPAFAGARWYELDIEVVDPDILLESGNAFAAMAYLRSVQDFYD